MLERDRPFKESGQGQDDHVRVWFLSVYKNGFPFWWGLTFEYFWGYGVGISNFHGFSRWVNESSVVVIECCDGSAYFGLRGDIAEILCGLENSFTFMPI